jgi:hydrogenase nickel incorporation protein HypA/HybF
VHEVGICADLLATVERRAAGRRVTGVKVRVGALHAVAPPAFSSAFELVAAGTVAADAALDLVVLPVRMRCRGCGEQTAGDELVGLCPRCGAGDLELTGGDELMLESITVAGGDGDVPRHPG